jgi:hypothetical protein
MVLVMNNFSTIVFGKKNLQTDLMVLIMLLWYILSSSLQIQYHNFYSVSSYCLLLTIPGFSSLSGSN